MKRIVVFKNQVAQYDVLHHFRISLCHALERLGIEIEVVDFSDQTISELINSLSRNPPDCTLSFNGLESIDGRTFLADELKVPHIAWLVDSAHYFRSLVQSTHTILIVPDQVSCDLFHCWGNPRTYFLPHAFDKSLSNGPTVDKIYPICFLGSLMDYHVIEEKWKSLLPQGIFTDFIEACEIVVFTSDVILQVAFNEVISRHGTYFSSIHQDAIVELMNQFDYYIRAKHRIRLLQYCRDFPIHLFGNFLSRRTWKDFLDVKKGSYIIHEAVTFPHAIEVMRQSQIILNSSPMFKTGGHERIFYGLGLGSLVLTNETPWLASNFSINEEILAYGLDKFSVTDVQIRSILSDSRKIERLSKNGQAKVLEKHTWDHRAQQLINILEVELSR